MTRLIPPGWRVLAVPDYRRLWLAHAGSAIGDGFHAIAITWLVFQTLGGGPQALAVLGIANSTAMNLTSPVSLAVTGAFATVAGPVLLITISGLGLMGVGALSLAASLRDAARVRPAST